MRNDTSPSPEASRSASTDRDPDGSGPSPGRERDLRARLEAAERELDLKSEILARISDLVVAVDEDGLVTFVNEEAARRLDLDVDAAIGREVSELYRYAYAPGTSETEVLEALRKHDRWRGEVSLLTGAEERIVVDAHVVNLRGDRGERTGRVAVMRDISERKRTEQKLFESRERLRLALENIPLTAAVVDHDFRYRWVYNTAVRFPTDDVVGRRVDEVLRPEDAAKFMSLKQRTLEEERHQETELEMELQGERHVYHVVAEPYRDAEGEVIGVMTSALDVTDRKKMEEDLRAAKNAAEGASRSKSAFLASMSHELRTPLNAVVGYADLLEEGIPVAIPDAARRHVERIRISARHLLHLIEEILDFTRMEAGQETAELAEVDLDELVREVEAVVEPLTAQKGLRLSVSTEGAPDRLVTDPRKLRQILFNLLGNAAKYTDEGGVTLRVSKDDDAVEFSVIDTGPGLSEQSREKLFEPFWRDEQVENGESFPSSGTGLGLAISLRYARLMGGEIDVESPPGAGATFTLRLPLRPDGG